MAQYDLLLTQNTHATLIEFSEKYVNLAKGSLLTADSVKTPTVLNVGADNYVLIANSAAATGLQWVLQSSLVGANSHVQNTDTGTTSTTFSLATAGFNTKLSSISATKMGVEVAAGTYADFEAKDAIFASVSVTAAPTVSAHLANKGYVDGLLAANDAMTFKGSIGSGGTLNAVGFTGLSTYSAGDTYKVITAATYMTKDGSSIIAEVGDIFIATIDRVGSGWTAGDWIAIQSNIDGAVIGPSTATADAIALFNSTTGKLIKDSAKTIVTTLGTTDATLPTSKAVKDLTDTLIPKSIITAANQIIVGTGSATPSVLTLTASTLFGMKASGIAAVLTASEATAILDVVVAAGAKGLMSGADKTKLDNIASNATANTVATGAEINTGTDNIKYASPLAIANSQIAVGPASSVSGRIATFGDITGKQLADSGKSIADFMLAWVSAPTTKASAGTLGQISYDSNYLYICKALNTWTRVALATNW